MEPRNIVGEDLQEHVSAEAAVLNSRVHYYGRLAGSSDRLLVPFTRLSPPSGGKTPLTLGPTQSGVGAADVVLLSRLTIVVQTVAPFWRPGWNWGSASRSQTGAINHSTARVQQSDVVEHRVLDSI